jgi:phosphate uptake regulator
MEEKKINQSPFGAPVGRRSPSHEPVDGPRRLQRMGAVTVGVSLPRAWVGERGLVAGNPIHLKTLPDGSLLLRDRVQGTAQGRSVILVNSQMAPEHLFRQLIGAYLSGASEFLIYEDGGISAQTRGVAKTFVRRTVQPEIVSEESTTLLLKDVSLGTGLPLPQLLHRMFQVVDNLQQEAALAWDAGGRHRPESLETRDDEVDRHEWLIERVLTLRLTSEVIDTGRNTPFEDPMQCLLLARALERVADHAVQIQENGSRLLESSPPRRILASVGGFHRQVLENLRRAFRVAESPDAGSANDIIDTGEALHATHRTLTEGFLAHGGFAELSPIAVASLGLVLQSIDRTAAYAQDIAQVGLDRAAWGLIDRSPRRTRAVGVTSPATNEQAKQGGRK